MAKRRIDHATKLDNNTERNITFWKRKRGLLKKAMELSMLCDKHVYVMIFDKQKQKGIEFKSHDDFDARLISVLTKPKFESQITFQKFDNSHYSEINELTKRQLETSIILEKCDVLSKALNDLSCKKRKCSDSQYVPARSEDFGKEVKLHFPVDFTKPRLFDSLSTML